MGSYRVVLVSRSVDGGRVVALSELPDGCGTSAGDVVEVVDMDRWGAGVARVKSVDAPANTAYLVVVWYDEAARL